MILAQRQPGKFSEDPHRGNSSSPLLPPTAPYGAPPETHDDRVLQRRGRPTVAQPPSGPINPPLSQALSLSAIQINATRPSSRAMTRRNPVLAHKVTWRRQNKRVAELQTPDLDRLARHHGFGTSEFEFRICFSQSLWKRPRKSTVDDWASPLLGARDKICSHLHHTAGPPEEKKGNIDTPLNLDISASPPILRKRRPDREMDLFSGRGRSAPRAKPIFAPTRATRSALGGRRRRILSEDWGSTPRKKLIYLH